MDVAPGHFPRAARAQSQAGRQMSASDGGLCGTLSERITAKRSGEKRSQECIKKV